MYFVGSNNDVALAFAGKRGEPEYDVARVSIYYSTDGSGFGSKISVGNIQIGKRNFNSSYMKHDYLRVDSYPRLAADPVNGGFYVVWAGNDSNDD